MSGDSRSTTSVLGRDSDPDDRTDSGGLWRALPFDLSLQVWGYEVVGDASNAVALTAERPSEAPWDRTARSLEAIERWHESARMPVPEWWALYVAPDLVMKESA